MTTAAVSTSNPYANDLSRPVPDSVSPSPPIKPSKPDSTNDRSPAVVVTISPEAEAAYKGSKSNLSGYSVASTAQSDQSTPTTLPDVVVIAVNANVGVYEQILRASQNPSVNDYGQIAMQVNAYYSAQYSLAGQAYTWVNDHVQVDADVNMNDTNTKNAVETAKAELVAVYYQALSKPTASINGPGSTDITGQEFRDRIADTTIIMRGDAPPPNRIGETTYNSDGTNIIRLWPSSFAGAMSNATIDAVTTTALFHELGHVMNRTETTQVLASFLSSNQPPNGNMTYLQAAAAWPTSSPGILAEQRATAMGHGLAELASPNIAATYFVGGIEHGEAPR